MLWSCRLGYPPTAGKASVCRRFANFGGQPEPYKPSWPASRNPVTEESAGASDRELDRGVPSRDTLWLLAGRTTTKKSPGPSEEVEGRDAQSMARPVCLAISCEWLVVTGRGPANGAHAEGQRHS